ncbi:hypothetical protein TNCV_4658681 [Trichonephila clavipes]|nr:hypothetical protein TNCV_4658681 [Trichonephila clavipes]
MENIQTTLTDQLKAIPISQFYQCYREWKKRLQRCVASEGSYFEEDNVEFYLNVVSFRLHDAMSSSFTSVLSTRPPPKDLIVLADL